jgi:hypothetical protein
VTLRLDEHAIDGLPDGGDHSVTRRDDRGSRLIDNACAVTQTAREEVAERRIRVERELRFIEVRTDRARERAIRKRP